jgi:hypothetical protein
VKDASTEGEGFISYRRQESDALATLLMKNLREVLPGWRFFHDLGAIPPGSDFRDVIDAALAKSDLLIVLIEEGWVGARANGTSRITDEGDFVRYEVASALKQGTRILPVLVNDAKMPSRAVLPADLGEFADKNAMELRVSRFEDDFARLVEVISGEPMQRRKSPWPGRIASWAAGAAAAVVAGVGVLYVNYALTGRSLGAVIGNDGATVISILWVLAGAWLGDLLGRRRKRARSEA